MFFFKAEQDMGLDASLSLLNLSLNATIDDANQAYGHLHRMIDVFHRDNDTDQTERQEDLELLACAYEKAVSFLSDPGTEPAAEPGAEVAVHMADCASPAANLHFTINFSSPAAADSQPDDDGAAACDTESDTVENAIAIIARRLQEAESGLDEARQSLQAATEALKTANQRLEQTKQVRMKAIIDAKAATSRAHLMEIEAERATQEANAVAQKARDRAKAARQAAKAARIEADGAKARIREVIRDEETAVAESVCAEDHLEEATQRLNTLIHAVVEARSRLRIFESYGAAPGQSNGSADRRHPAEASGEIRLIAQDIEASDDGRKRIMSDLMDIEHALCSRKHKDAAASDGCRSRRICGQAVEKRRHERLHYPEPLRPLFAYQGRTIPVLDLSHTGMGLAADDGMGQSHLVRGAIVFEGLPMMNVTGRVVRQDDRGLGLRLVTRIGKHILDRERMRLGT